MYISAGTAPYREHRPCHS